MTVIAGELEPLHQIGARGIGEDEAQRLGRGAIGGSSARSAATGARARPRGAGRVTPDRTTQAAGGRSFLGPSSPI